MLVPVVESHSALQLVHAVKLLQGAEAAQVEVLGGLWAVLLPSRELCLPYRPVKVSRCCLSSAELWEHQGKAAAPPASPHTDSDCPAVQEGLLSHG